MEIKNENKNFDVDNYIKEVEQKLYDCNTLEKIENLKNEVAPVYVEEYNKQILSGSDLAKISSLITRIQTKESELKLLKIAEDNVEIMKEYAELLKNMEKAYNALNKKGE